MTRLTIYWHIFVTLIVFSRHSQVSAQVFTGDGTAYTLGSTSSGNCNMMAANSDAGDNYAALNDPQWDGSKSCGRCAQVSCADDRCADKSISQVVQILDRCPACKSGDLDLSPTVFKKITGLDNLSKYTIKWQFVDCPVSGNIKYCLKSGSNPYFVAIQPTNTVAGVAKMEVNSKPVTMVNSAYYFLLNGQGEDQVDLSAVTITLTALDNQTITETVALQPGSCTEGTLQFASGGGATVANAEADTVVMLLMESAQPTTSPATLSSPSQAAPAPPVVNAAITLTADTPGPPATTAPATTAPVPVSDPPSSSAPVVTIAPAPVPPPIPAPASAPATSQAPAPALAAVPHPSVHRCKVKHNDDPKYKHKDY